MSVICESAILERMKSREPLWGSWNITDYLGAGAYGCVFKIEKKTEGHSFVSALKVIPLTRKLDKRLQTLQSLQASVGREAQEIMLLYKLGIHQNVVTWYDHHIFYQRGKDSVTADISVRIDYMPNSLPRVMSKGPLHWEKAITILQDCLRGLTHIHTKGIIHRDIKPENIFIADDDKAKIGDFGVARRISDEEHAATRVGTPLYIAPEVVTDPLGEGYDHRVDIYSLGLVGYEMLTGKLPFEAECQGNKTCMVKKRLSGKVIQIYRSLPQGVKDALLGALAFNKDQRYSTAEEFNKALDRVLETGGRATIPPKGRQLKTQPEDEEDAFWHRLAGEGTATNRPKDDNLDDAPIPDAKGTYTSPEPATVMERYRREFMADWPVHYLTRGRVFILIMALLGAGGVFLLHTYTNLVVVSYPVVYLIIPLFFVFHYRAHVLYTPICFAGSFLLYSYLYKHSFSEVFAPITLLLLGAYILALALTPLVVTVIKDSAPK